MPTYVAKEREKKNAVAAAAAAQHQFSIIVCMLSLISSIGQRCVPVQSGCDCACAAGRRLQQEAAAAAAAGQARRARSASWGGGQWAHTSKERSSTSQGGGKALSKSRPSQKSDADTTTTYRYVLVVLERVVDVHITCSTFMSQIKWVLGGGRGKRFSQRGTLTRQPTLEPSISWIPLVVTRDGEAARLLTAKSSVSNYIYNITI